MGVRLRAWKHPHAVIPTETINLNIDVNHFVWRSADPGHGPHRRGQRTRPTLASA
jgi:hypothetical protein